MTAIAFASSGLKEKLIPCRLGGIVPSTSADDRKLARDRRFHTREFAGSISAAPKFLRVRWLELLLWFESKAAVNQPAVLRPSAGDDRRRLGRPALVSLNVRQNDVAETLAWTTVAVSLVVAVSAALDGFFRFGDHWCTFRRTAELLKAQGWQYFELSGPYAGTDHAGAFTAFAGHVESLIEQDVKAFITQVAPTRPAPARAQPDQEAPDQPRSAPTS